MFTFQSSLRSQIIQRYDFPYDVNKTRVADTPQIKEQINAVTPEIHNEMI